MPSMPIRHSRPTRALLACATLLASLASPLHGQVNLSWNDCGGSGTLNMTSACTSNTGSHTLVCSYVAPTGVDSLSSSEIRLDLISASDPLPAWWQLRSQGVSLCSPAGTTACRDGALSVDVDFTNGPSACIDYWDGAAISGFGFESPPCTPDPGQPFPYASRRARMFAVCAIRESTARSLTAGAEYYSCKLHIDDRGTTGAGACGGCDTPVCIALTSIRLNQNPGVPMPRDRLLSGAPIGGRDFVTWQGGAGADCALVPARNVSWGRVKSLYR